MVQDTPSRKLDQYIVRFPDGMRDRLKDEAAKNGRSLNAEIIHRLEGSLLGMPKSTSVDDVAESFIRKFADAPYRPGMMDRLNDLYLKAKQAETRTIRNLYEALQQLLEPNWDWDNLPKDNVPNIPKPRRETKKKA